MRSENRNYIRFVAQDNAYAALGTHFSRVGKLKDISVDGLGFEYIDNAKGLEQDSSVVSIFHTEEKFFLPHLACRLIYDKAICIKTSQSYFKATYLVKRCAVQFIDINAQQKKKLNFFLNNYTCGKVPSQKELSLTP